MSRDNVEVGGRAIHFWTFDRLSVFERGREGERDGWMDERFCFVVFG